MSKKSTSKPAEATTLAVVEAPKSLTVRPIPELLAYESASKLIGEAYDEAVSHGVPFIGARLRIGYFLAQIRANGEKGSLKTFCDLANKGAGPIKRMSRATLMRSLQMFDLFCEDEGIKKKDVPALEDKYQLGSTQLELWTKQPPTTASELQQRIYAWAMEKGMRHADSEVLAPPTKPPHVDDPEPSDPAALDLAKAEAFLTDLATWVETDLFCPNADGAIADHTDPKLADHPCTWSLMTQKDMNRLLKLGEKIVNGATHVIRIRAGKVKGKR